MVRGAIAVYTGMLDEPRRSYRKDPYFGSDYSNGEVQSTPVEL